MGVNQEVLFIQENVTPNLGFAATVTLTLSVDYNGNSFQIRLIIYGKW